MKGFAVHPKLDCPHLLQTQVNELSEFLLNSNNKHFSEFACATCGDKQQNWICLECKLVACSRYVKGHMAEHHDEKKHPITLSFSDSSFWCYQCDSYIDHRMLIKARRQFSKSKFASIKQEEHQKKQQDTNELDEQKLMEQEFKKLEIEEALAQNKKEEEEKKKKQQEEKQKDEIKFTYEQIIDELKNKKYKKVVFLTGAGLSVAAGIPDFRSPGTGLYSQLQKFNLPRPEAVFELTYFASNPQPFIKLSRQWGAGDFKPTDGHKFIKKVQTQGILYYCMTQNIDDLESKAGISENKLIQAHGHSRSAHCIKCKKQANIQAWKTCIEKDECLKCNDQSCGGLVKPDIVFFGEQLPPSFHKAPELVKEADLVIIIGTSLAVFPFAFLAHMIDTKVPVILINNEDSLQGRSNKVWLSGDIQQNIRRISKDLDWTL